MIKIQKVPNSLIKEFILKQPLFDNNQYRWESCHIEYHWDKNSKSKGTKWLNLTYVFAFKHCDYLFFIKITDSKLCYDIDRNNRKLRIIISYDLQKTIQLNNDNESFKRIDFCKNEIFYPVNDIPTEVEITNFKTYKDISDQLIENFVTYMYEKAINENVFDKAFLEIKKDIERLQIEFLNDISYIDNLN